MSLEMQRHLDDACARLEVLAEEIDREDLARLLGPLVAELKALVAGARAEDGSVLPRATMLLQALVEAAEERKSGSC